jgi:hypothetical protein
MGRNVGNASTLATFALQASPMAISHHELVHISRNCALVGQVLEKQAGQARKRPKKQACLALRSAMKWDGPQAQRLRKP